jgi:hypothetical protein
LRGREKEGIKRELREDQEKIKRGWRVEIKGGKP